MKQREKEYIKKLLRRRQEKLKKKRSMILNERCVRGRVKSNNGYLVEIEREMLLISDSFGELKEE